MLPYFDNCIRSFNIYKYMLVLKLLAFRFFFQPLSMLYLTEGILTVPPID